MGMKETRNFDYYTWRKMDHTNAEDRQLVETFWNKPVVDESKVLDQTVRAFRWVR
eukprot:NODE_12419_length_280_cov_9.346320_g11506_i0.p2 GENE.NODE_12419_length_280_cov_9.346320_g11506_i0~~NODE_12419_length_280_cov_9.346320_g11506_i0.p2  ORF type:complete len:64 (+),score=12.57 NODE_12419_length_280_cov_9.346320_g11506_i0:28-192(+)